MAYVQRITAPNSRVPYIRVPGAPQSQEEFEALLNQLRPTYKEVEIRSHRAGKDGREVIFTVIVEGKMVDRRTKFIQEDEEYFEEEVEIIMEELTNQYKYSMPRLWPGCRGVIARHYGIDMDYHFNRWFDYYANNKG